MDSTAALNHAHFLELLDRVPAAVAVLSGPEHLFAFVNPEFLRVSGRSTPEQLLGKTFRQAFPELEGQIFVALLDDAYRTGVPFIGKEMKVLLNRSQTGGDEAYFNFVYEPIKQASGSVSGIFVHAVEVTEQVLQRKQMDERAHRVTLAQAAAQIGTWEWDPERKQSILSPELHDIFATSANDPQYAAVWSSRIHPDDAAEVQEETLQGYKAGGMQFEYRYIHPQRGMRWLFCKGWRQSKQSHMFGVVFDITQRKHAEEATARLAAIVESSDDAIVAKDLNGVITNWNAGAHRIFEYTSEEAVGKHITLIIPPEHRAEENEILRRLRLGERIEHFETVRVAKSGRRIDVSLTVSPIRNSQGRVIGASKVARDITQRKQSEKALREAHEQLEQRVRERTAELEAAHQALRMLSGRLLQAQDEERRRIARELHDSAGQLVAALNMNLVPIQAEAGKLGEQFTRAVDESLELVDQLSQELRTISHLLHPPMLDEAGLEFALQWFVEGFAQRSKIDVDFESTPDLGRLPREVETTIFRIVQESLTNIHRHSGSRTAAVRLNRDAEQVTVEIEDQGKGMPGGSTVRMRAGVGIQGMRERVRQLGGLLEIRSSPGAGTTVTVTLPLHTTSNAAQPAQSAQVI